jgi:murein DD-endopeptidase MepM/ murein hydrolase activator NlpD
VRLVLPLAAAVCGALTTTGCLVIKDSPADTTATGEKASVAAAAAAQAARDSIAARHAGREIGTLSGPAARTVNTPGAAAGKPIDTLSSLGSTRDSLVARGSREATRVDSLVLPTPDDIAALRAELAMPVAGILPSQLFDSFDEKRGSSRRHEAIDIPAPRGTPVLSAAPGRVMRLFSSKDGGLMIYAADGSERFILMYAHLDSYARGLADGATLERGQPIGYVGTTGNAPPNVPHLHFAIARTPDVARWWTGVPVNPYPLLHGR